MKTKLGTLLITIFLISTGCSDSGPSPATVSMKLKASSATSTFSSGGRTASSLGGRTSAASFTFTKILLGVTELEFETSDENLQEDQLGETENEEVEYKGQFVIDLITGTSTPDFGSAGIAPGQYEEIEIEVAPILPAGNSVFIAFEASNGAEISKIEFSSTDSLEFEIEPNGGFTLDANALNKMLVLFNLDILFDGIDFSQATKDSDGVIRINANSNTSIASVISNRLDESFDAGEDDNDDGEIDN